MNILSSEVIFPFALGIGYFFFFVLKELKLNRFFSELLKTSQPVSGTIPISVVIACKNEEKNISDLLSAIESIEYPKDKCEFIIVDDGSTDRTLELLTKFASENKNIKVIKAGNKVFPAKKGALHAGIQNALFDSIMITDADCAPQKNWLISAEYSFLKGNGVVFGIAPYKDEVGFIHQFFCYEQFAASTHYLSAALAGYPYSAAARNFGFTKAVYDELGGYSGTLESVGGDDDLFLLQAVNRNKSVGVIPCLDQSFPVSTAPQDWDAYFAQRSRHVKTSDHYRTGTQTWLAVFHSVHFLSLISVFFCGISSTFVLPLLLKLAGDTRLAHKYAVRFNYNFGIFRTLSFIFLYELTIPVNFFNSIFRKDKWK